jgi:Undecaprenyl-phosphate galactose phosphotransferase WbaP
MGTQAALSEVSFRPATIGAPAAVPTPRPRVTSCVLLVTDLFAIFAARVLAMTICHWFHPAVGFPNFNGLRESLVLFVLTYAALGLYAGGGISTVEELRRAALGTHFVCLSLTASLFFLQQPQPNPGLLILSGSLTAAAVPLARSAARALFAKTRWWGVPVIILGTGQTATALIERLQKHPEIGFKPLACFDDDHREQRECEGLPVYGPLSLAGALAKSLKVRHALVAIPGMAREDLVWMLDDWGTVFTHVILIPNLFGLASLWASARDIGGMLGLEMRQNLLIPFNRWTKRAMDIAGALILGLLALPILGVAAVWIKLMSRGSVLYNQEREGEKGGAISIVKLRTMRPDAESALIRALSESSEIRAEWECHFKLRRDPRILGRVGKFLRRTSLDELPQLWSVLKGEMSLVGPRPFPRYHLDGFGQRFRTLRGRVKPGLTGLWQVSDRADGDLEVQETLDTYYIRNWSLWLDLYILVRTVRAVLCPKGAY